MINQYILSVGAFLAGILITYAFLIKRQSRLQAKLDLVEQARAEERQYRSEVEANFQAAFQNLAQDILDTKARG